MPDTIKVHFIGPYSWYGQDGIPSIFSSEMKNGVYLWSVPYQDGQLVYYVGVSGRKFSVRMMEHFREHMSGSYHLNEPQALVQGKKVMLWPGRYDPDKKVTVDDFIDAFPNLAPVIYELAKRYRFWLAPINGDRRLRERIEAALAMHLYDQPGIIGDFQEKGVRYLPRRQNENLIKSVFEADAKIYGLPDFLWV